MSTKTLFVGIDIGKRRHVVSVIDSNKQVLATFRAVLNTLDSYQALRDELLHLAQTHGAEEFLIGLEATGNYWQNLFYFLLRAHPSFRLVLLNPEQTHAFARSELRRGKTDPLDALGIARLLAERRPRPTQPIPVETTILKDLDAHLQNLSRERARLVNRLRAELAKVAPEVEEQASSGLSRQLLTVLRSFPTAEAIRRASPQALGQLRSGRAQSRLPRAFVEKLKTLTAQSVAYKTGPGSHLVVQSLARLILTVEAEHERLSRELLRLYHRWHGSHSLLTTIKGIGPQTAIALEAHIGDVHRFSNARTLIAYLGLNPTIRQSGSSLSVQGAIQKKGNSRLRQRLYMATLAIVATRQGPIWRFYDRLVRQGKAPRVALVAAMRKLVVVCYAMLKRQEPYDPKR